MKDGKKTKAQLISELTQLRQRIAELEASEAELKRAEDEAKRRNEKLTVLNAIAATVSRSLNLQEILDRALDKVLEVTGGESGSISLLDQQTEKPLLAAHRGESKGKGEIRSFAAIPMKSKGKAQGVIPIASYQNHLFSAEELELYAAVADQIGVAVENARLFEEASIARDRLRTLSRRLLKAQEAERRRIARELHDEIGQCLTGLRLTLETSAFLPAETVREKLAEAQMLVNELIAEVRDMSLDLRPPTLDDLGLIPALLSQFERYTAYTHVHVAFDHTGVQGRRFSPEMETAVYRIVQEALTNVARYAGVNEATVRLCADQVALRVQIEDRGVGFDPQAALAAGRSSGLDGMQERVALLGGQLIIESSPGGGTCLTAKLPLNG